jgi:hypothetical protein
VRQSFSAQGRALFAAGVVEEQPDAGGDVRATYRPVAGCGLQTIGSGSPTRGLLAPVDYHREEKE